MRCAQKQKPQKGQRCARRKSRSQEKKRPVKLSTQTLSIPSRRITLSNYRIPASVKEWMGLDFNQKTAIANAYRNHPAVVALQVEELYIKATKSGARFCKVDSVIDRQIVDFGVSDNKGRRLGVANTLTQATYSDIELADAITLAQGRKSPTWASCFASRLPGLPDSDWTAEQCLTRASEVHGSPLPSSGPGTKADARLFLAEKSASLEKSAKKKNTAN
jgi:hypothetical protein